MYLNAIYRFSKSLTTVEYFSVHFGDNNNYNELIFEMKQYLAYYLYEVSRRMQHMIKEEYKNKRNK